MTKLRTIKLQGKNYVQVVTRVEEFHKQYKNGSIMTEVTLTDEGKKVIFKATIIPDSNKPERFFNGHSFGTTSQLKSLEKLETVSVGRALAFLGIGIEGGLEISSSEEAKEHNKRVKEEEKELSINPETEIAPFCTKCGLEGIRAKRTNGSIFWTCPEWKLHKEEGEKFEMKQKAQPLGKQEQEFADTLPK